MRKPRPFQIEQCEAVKAAFKRGLKGVVVCAPTGTGKLVSMILMSKLALEKGGRVLILLNRDILIEQTIAELRLNEVFAQREQGSERALLTADMVVGSVQSMTGERLKKWSKDYFRMVLTDECHGSGSSSFKTILDHFSNVYHVGFSATPERHDKRALWKGYQEMCFNMTLQEAIADGWLCGFEFVELECPVTVDLKLMKHATFSETEEVFDSTKYLPRLADCAVSESQERKGLFFLPNCRVSARFALMLQERGLNARHIDSSYMPASQTSDLLAWYRAEKHAILCNSDLLSVGFNDPPTDVIGLFRPIASTPMYKQRLGRGTRPIARVDDYDTAEERKEAIARSFKPCCKVLNVFWENGSHDLAAPSCLITDDKAEQRAMSKATKPGQRVDLAQLEMGLKAMRNEQEEMRKFAEKVANSQEKRKRGGLYIGDILKRFNPSHKPASPQFIRYIKRQCGVSIPAGNYSAHQMHCIRERWEKEMKKVAA